MKLCILDNDVLDAAVQPIYHGYGVMTERLLRGVGSQAEFDIFNTVNGQYPQSFASYDAVLLTGSRSDAFSTQSWVLALRQKVEQLLAAKKKLIGICFGHQLIALCLGARVGRAQQGWAMGCQDYQWLANDLPAAPRQPDVYLSLLASHQDQVFELPKGARLTATSEFCPVAGFVLEDRIFCIQPHPEFVLDYSAYLLNKRRELLGEKHYQVAVNDLTKGHDGDVVARMMLAFVDRDC